MTVRRCSFNSSGDTIKQGRGEKTTDVEGLKLDHDYNRSVFGAKRK